MTSTARRITPCLVAILLAFAPVARAETPVEVIPLAVRDGRCEAVLATPRADDKFYLIIGSLARDLGPRRVTIRTESTTDPVSIPREDPPANDTWARQTRELNDKLEKSRKDQAPPHDYAPADNPPKDRVFYLFVKDRDLLNPDSYVSVTGDLRAVGKHCQVYVDHEYPDSEGLLPTIKDVIATFDAEIYPQACKRLGHALDVDRDGRFTILFTPWLDKLGDGKIKLDGFMRGSDFYRDIDGPQGNRCDMMYLNPGLKPGPYLRTLLAHEYAHAVVFSEHVFGDYLPDETRREEESWLNEGLAHLNEDAHGYSWANLDYRISAFLAAPERYSLVVPDYYTAGLFRSHGHRGATYLFLRWCVDRDGPDLVRKLVQTNQSGVANLETATGRRFADLFREWSVAILLNDSALSADAVEGDRTFHARTPLAGRLLSGPRVEEIELAGAKRQADLAGTSAGYYLLHSAKAERSRLTITADIGTDIQVTLVRVPRSLARLSLRWEKGRLLVTAYDGDITLDAAAWERVPPVTNRAEDTSYRADQAMDKTVRAWFGDPHLKSAETKSSAAIELPTSDPAKEKVIFKVSGTDAAGHRVAAYAELPAPR